MRSFLFILILHFCIPHHALGDREVQLQDLRLHRQKNEFLDPAGGLRQRSSSSALPYQLPSPPPILMEPQVYQQYIVDSFKIVLNAIATLSRCGYVAPTRRRRRSPAPTSGSEHED